MRALLILLAFCGAAWRADAMTTPDRADLDMRFACFPSAATMDKEDNDPVVISWVRLFVNDDMSVRFMGITHITRADKAYDRISQYGTARAKPTGEAKWTWMGIRNNDPNVAIAGTLFYDNRWIYSEDIYRGGRKVKTYRYGCFKQPIFLEQEQDAQEKE
jgi:hypothetical protein